MLRVMTLQLQVKVPDTTTESEVHSAINAALDEPPCDWGIWYVGAAQIIAIDHESTESSDGFCNCCGVELDADETNPGDGLCQQCHDDEARPTVTREEYEKIPDYLKQLVRPDDDA